jgi:hypothetical protein
MTRGVTYEITGCFVILNLIQDLKRVVLISWDSVLNDLRNDGVFRHSAHPLVILNLIQDLKHVALVS